MAVAGLRILMAMSLSALCSLATAEKAATRIELALAAAMRQRQLAAEGAASGAAARLAAFESQARSLHGHRHAAARIGALARSLESKDCRYDQDLADTQAAVQHFVSCVAKIQGIAHATLDSAETRGRLNKEYGEASEASLARMQKTVQHLNDLQRSIVVEHKTAADHLAQEITAIKHQVGEIWEVNEDHRHEKGWQESSRPAPVQAGFRSEPAKLDTTQQVVAEVSGGGKVALAQESSSASENGDRVSVKADNSDDEEPVASGESLAELRQELRSVQAKLAAAEQQVH